MKLQIVSDLHLEWGNISVVDKIGKYDSDVLILAGDIHNHNRLESCLKYIQKRVDKTIIFVPGNHDYYPERHVPFISKETFYEKLNKTFKKNNSIHVLDNETITLDDIVFLGSTSWCDQSNGIIKEKINDFNYINDINNITRWGKDSRKFFEKELKKNSNAVCISHNAPSNKSIHEYFKNAKTNTLFANNWDELIIKYEPRLWIHGHVHNSFDYYINKTRIVCNPKGYPIIQDANSVFNPGLIIEI